jgi:hypothetical protein
MQILIARDVYGEDFMGTGKIGKRRNILLNYFFKIKLIEIDIFV